ncbi:MAG: hypothetical protein MST10_04190 [Lentisphaeria bacterium]|nr:hypothetical protein [Lentisphaeria bacterium]
MSLTAFILILLSAGLHATWNFISKKHNPSAAFYMMASMTGSAIWLTFFLLGGIDFTRLPGAFYAMLLGSIGFETLYCGSLAYAYRKCDISLAYPLGRALPVVMVAAVSMLFHLGQPLNYIQISGMIVIFSGCLLMPLKKIAEFSFRHYISQGFLLIMLVAIGTTGYTVLDSQALKTYKESLVFEPVDCRFFTITPDVMASCSYLFMVELGIVVGLTFVVISSPFERGEFKKLFGRNFTPVLTGMCSSTAYGLILLAMNFVTNVSFIQPLRQLSLPLGMMLGVIFLGEKVYKIRIAGIICILAGILLSAL